jgi:hypothetical protein
VRYNYVHRKENLLCVSKVCGVSVTIESHGSDLTVKGEEKNVEEGTKRKQR